MDGMVSQGYELHAIGLVPRAHTNIEILGDSKTPVFRKCLKSYSATVFEVCTGFGISPKGANLAFFSIASGATSKHGHPKSQTRTLNPSAPNRFRCIQSNLGALRINIGVSGVRV